MHTANETFGVPDPDSWKKRTVEGVNKAFTYLQRLFVKPEKGLPRVS